MEDWTMAKREVWDAYVLISRGSAADRQRALDDALGNGARWSGSATGVANGVLAITADNSFDLERIIARQRIGGIVLDVLRRRGRKPCPVKRTSLPPSWVEALVVISAQDGQAKAVRGQISQLGGVAAVAVVAGNANVLAHFQASDDAALEVAIGQLHGVGGIASRDTLGIRQVRP
jgi:hypothetical protein